jgi:hypothetical protein
MRLADAARALVATANREGGEDNITVVLFALEGGDPSEPTDDDTLSGLEVPAITLTDAAPLPAATTNGQPEQSAPRAAVSAPRPRSARRAAIVIALVLVLFAGLAALALWGLSRAHFVGADEQGRVVVYQGVPWNLFGDSVKLYRETYVSRLLATQLTPAEREQLFDHSLIGEGAARAEIARYEQEATPGTPRP